MTDPSFLNLITESESDFESSEIDSNIDTDDTETEESDIDETIEDTVTAKDKIITEEEGTRWVKPPFCVGV